MKTVSRFFITALILLAFGGLLYSQEQSDYEIKRGFEKKYNELMKAIDGAQTVQECAGILASIQELEKDYTPHKALLDKVLFPDDFTKRLESVNGRLLYAQTKLGIIQDAVAKIAELETQVRELSSKVDKLTSENNALMSEMDALRKAKATDQKAIDSLKALVTKLKSNIADRDRIIFAMVDSIFLQYDKNVENIKDVTKQRLVSHLDKNNIVASVKKAIVDNVTFLEATALSGTDFASLVVEQKKFASQWKGLGPKLTSIYMSQKERSKELATIDTMIVEWGKRVDGALWKTLNETFTKRGLTVKPFVNGDEFYTNVMSFMDDEIQNVLQKTDEARYNTYAVFVDTVWNTELTTVWMPILRDEKMVTEKQFNDMKEKVDDWRDTIKPPRTLLYVSIGVVILAIFLYLYRKMKKPQVKPTVP